MIRFCRYIAAGYRRMMQRFLDGPEFLSIPQLQRRPDHYRSPTLALAMWCAGLMLRFCSPAALFLMPALWTILFYATVALDSPTRILLLVATGMWLIDFFVGLLFRPAVEIERRAPRRVRAGSEFTVSFQLRNRRRLPVFDLRLDPFGYSGNLRTVSGARIAALPGRKSAVAEAKLLATGRGVCKLYSPWAQSGFPFGLWMWNSRKRRAQETICIYPAFRKLRRLHLPTGRRSQLPGLSGISKNGESQELMGCREFREGDEVRHIDWPGSARRGKLTVKEFAEERLRRVALIVDTHVPPARSYFSGKSRPATDFEAALSLTAALADKLGEGDAIVDIFAAGPEVYHFTTGRHLSRFETLCDILAALNPSPRPVLQALAPEVFTEIRKLGAAVVILLRHDRRRRELLDALAAHGVQLKVIAVDFPGETPGDWLRIDSAAVLAGKVVEL